MRRTNLYAKPTETLDVLAGDPSNWKDFKNGAKMSLQPGRYVASCNVTERGSNGAVLQYWDEVHHLRLAETRDVAIGVNVMQLDVQDAFDSCHFSVCGGRVTDFIVERADTHALASGGGCPGLLHRRHRAVLSLRRVTADETQKSSDGADQSYRQWVRGADGRIDLYRHGGRSAAFASMGQYCARHTDDRHVFRDPHGHVIRRYRDEREGDHRGWLGHHARNGWMVVGRHIARQGRARDHTVHRMFQRRGLAGHASFGRRLLRQGHGGILALALSLGVVA